MRAEFRVVLSVAVHLDTEQSLGRVVAAFHVGQGTFPAAGADPAHLLELGVLAHNGGVPGQAGGL